MAEAFYSADFNLNDDCELCLIDSGVQSLLDVPLTPHLQVLNLHCNGISVIENLTKLHSLRHLDLSSNKISRVEGLETLASLRTLNLACNNIQCVQGIGALKSLVRLNLSYNRITDLTGLQVIQSNDFLLSHLELQGNQLQSLAHVTRCLKGCKNLRNLIIKQSSASNAICDQPDYRRSILSTLPLLTALDGKDRKGQPYTMTDIIPDIPGLEQYMDYLIASSSSDMNPIKRAFPRIDAAVEAYRLRGATTPEISTTVSDHDTSHATQKSYRAGKTVDTEHEKRLERLEEQLADLLSAKGSVSSPNLSRRPGYSGSQYKAKRDVDETEESEEDKSTKNAKPGLRNRKPVKRNVKKPATAATKRLNPTSEDDVQRDDVRKTYSNMMKELESEKERRWKQEMQVKKLTERLQALQTQASEEKEMQSVAVGATSRLKELLSREREDKTRLQTDLDSAKEKMSRLEDEIQSLQQEEAETREALRMAEATSTRQERAGLQQQAHMAKRLQEAELKAAAMSREAELLKAAAKTSKQQLQQLQELLADREQSHRKELEDRFTINSPEMQAAFQKERNRIEELHAQELANHKHRVDSLSKQYSALEDEFRHALTSEETRFEQLQNAFETVSRENANNKQALLIAKDKDDKSAAVISELTAMIKEQKGRISELSKSKHEQTADMKERIQTMEVQLDEGRRKMVQLELLKKDNVKLQSQIQAQESVIEGLKSERKLWGEELAHQGASLAQDRGRLEAKIETLNSEMSLMRRNLDREADSVKIKSKMVEDQTETIRKLKEAVLERDEDIRKAREEGLKIQRDLEEQLATESGVNTDIQEQNDRLKIRKDELKQRVVELEDKLHESEEAHRSLSRKWQDKSSLISQLEKQVTAMKEQWEMKEGKMVEERDRAIEAASVAVEKLKTVDDAFRHQLDGKEESHQKAMQQMLAQKQAEIDLANKRVAEVEDEMRELLKESDIQKRQLEDRLKRLGRAFSELQHDLV